MILIALAAVGLAWYAHRAREMARLQAVAEAERARVVALKKREIEQLYAQMAKNEEILRKADEQIARAREALDPSKQPVKPSIGAIPGQVMNIIRLLEEQAKQDPKRAANSHAEVAGKIRARVEKKRLEESSTLAGGATPMTRAILTLLIFVHASALAQDKPTPSDESIRRALVYLKDSQKADGGWDAGFGRATSVTSLAVMSFLAAGHVPGEPGPYREAIDRGIRYVLAHQKANGMLVANTSHGPMYCHGISSLMLAEVVGMTNDAALADQCRGALSRAIDLILKAQDVPSKRKRPAVRRRLAVSAVVDRQRPERLGLAGDGPPRGEVGRLRRARRRTSTGPSATSSGAPRRGAVSATSPAASPTTRGPAPASSPWRSAASTSPPEAVLGAEYLVKHPPRWGSQYFFYEVYYCPQALFQVGDQYFDAYYPKLVDILLDHQDKDGSWLSGDGNDRSGGRVYCTSMAVLALAVEYRYLPIYQR